MIQIFKRIVRRYVFSYHLWIRNYSEKYLNLPSSLYIGLEHKAKVFSALDPHIDVKYTFRNIPKLKSDLEQRNISVDVDCLHREGLKYEKLSDLIKLTKRRIQDLYGQIRSLRDRNNEDEVKENLSSMERELTDAKFTLQKANQEFLLLEKSFILPYLQLPNPLHKNTTNQDENLFSLFPIPKFSFPVKSHLDIGSARNELEFRDVSPSAYYLKKNLAIIEMAVSDFLMARFQEHDFISYANIDLVRAVLAEGCGFDVNHNRKFLPIEDDSCLSSNLTQYLFGGSSLPSFVALFCKGVMNFEHELPVRMVSIGRKYNLDDTVEDTRPTLFNAIQSTCVSAFLAYPIEAVDEAMVNEIAMLLSQTYTELGLHFQLVQYGAAKLKSYESLAVGVWMYSPYYEKYIEVGRISLCQDFISKRLQIFQNMGKKKASFLNMIYVEVMDVRKWIGCLVENAQLVDGSYGVPDCLKPFMYNKV